MNDRITVKRTDPRELVILLSMASVAVTFGIQVISPALPEIQRVLDISNSQIGWVVSLYFLPGVILAIPMGILGEAVGRRRLLCTALLVYGMAALVQGCFLNFPLLLGMRALQGICFAAAMPLSIALIGDSFSGAQRIRALSIRSVIVMSSAVVLPMGGALLAEVSWRAPFLVQVVTIPIGLRALGIGEASRDPSAPKRRYALDLYKVLCSQAGVFTVLLAAFSRYFFKFGLLAYLPILLVRRGASLTEVGLVISFLSLSAIGSAAMVPRIIHWTPASFATIGSLAIMGLATAGFSVVPSWPTALVVATFFGVADGTYVVLQDSYTIHTAQSHVLAGMVSVSQTVRNLGKLSGPLVMAMAATISSLETAFVVLGASGLVLAPLLLPLRRMDNEFGTRPSTAPRGEREL